MQLIETLQDRQVVWRHRTRQIIDAAAADHQDLDRLCSRSIIVFALSNPALVSAPSKNRSPAAALRPLRK